MTMFHKSVLMANWTISYHLLPRAMEIKVNKIHFFMISPHLMEIFWYFICLNMYVILYIEHNRSTANNASHLSLILFTVWTLAMGEMKAKPSSTYLK